MTADSQQPKFFPNKNRRVSLCVGCGSQIHDPFILRVAPDLEWHASCLKCVDCNRYLDENCTCFVRDGKTYCRSDYTRLFGAKCSKCNKACTKNDFVMRARDNLYHIDCFRCVSCNRQLIPGDEFALRDDELFCKADHDELENDIDHTLDVDNIKVENEELPMEIVNNDNNNNNKKKENGKNKVKGGKDKSKNGESRRKSDQKPTRGRTVLNEKQLHTLCTWYNANPRPDALMKEQLVEMTNLSPRVIRVWFQNKRCKDNKRSILTKQMAQHHEKNVSRLCGPLQGVPMVASSPVRHESPMQMNPIEVQSYQQAPWQTYNTLQIKHETEQPPLQQLMNSFDNIDSDSTSSFHHSGYNDGYVWSHPDYDNNTQFSDSDYHDSRMSSSPLKPEYTENTLRN